MIVTYTPPWQKTQHAHAELMSYSHIPDEVKLQRIFLFLKMCV
jgi:hypothetical protein